VENRSSGEEDFSGSLMSPVRRQTYSSIELYQARGGLSPPLRQKKKPAAGV
jgi:hypothetical protein